MSQYLLSTYAVEGEAPRAPATPEEMGAFMQRVAALEAEMEASGTFVFGGALHGPGAATVVGVGDGDLVMTDGPFVDAAQAAFARAAHLAATEADRRFLAQQ